MRADHRLSKTSIITLVQPITAPGVAQAKQGESKRLIAHAGAARRSFGGEPIDTTCARYGSSSARDPAGLSLDA